MKVKRMLIGNLPRDCNFVFDGDIIAGVNTLAIYKIIEVPLGS
jgi:hypothetical protein